jgi:cardiolipin synthase A/B
MADWLWWIIVVTGYLATWLLIPWVLLKRSTHPSAAVAWIMTIVFVPFVGALLCAIAGTTRWEWRKPRKRRASQHINQHLSDLPATNETQTGCDGDSLPPLARIVANFTGANMTCGNQVELIPEQKRCLQTVEKAIRQAKHSVHVEFYIWRSDGSGGRLRDLLIEKARQGVQVRFLYDGFGSMLLSRKFLRPLQDSGAVVASFTPGLHVWHLLTLNLRNHRKLVVVDGHSAFTGGMNIGDEYFRKTDAYGNLRDTQLWVTGPAVRQLQRVFAQDWYYATGEELVDPLYFPAPDRPGHSRAQVVADGPDNDVDILYSLMLGACGLARERITLCTPYFVPPDGLAMALETAARRGVKVRLMTAERGNFPWTFRAGRSYYEPLLRAGVEIYEYQKGLFHAKTLSVDSEWAFVGTANCDFRSMYLNFEVGLSLFDAELAAQLDRHFDEDLKFANRIHCEAWLKRPTSAILQERFWRLFAPTL